MTAIHPIGNPLLKEVEQLVCILTLTNKQILNHKLILLRPPQPQIPCRRVLRVETARVEQVVDIYE